MGAARDLHVREWPSGSDLETLSCRLSQSDHGYAVDANIVGVE
jgi:hypothetical protein